MNGESYSYVIRDFFSHVNGKDHRIKEWFPDYVLCACEHRLYKEESTRSKRGSNAVQE